MAAISIIAIVLVAVYRLHAQTLSMNYSARFYVTAPMLAQKKMVEIESGGQEDMLDDSGDFGEEFPVTAGKLPWRMLNQKPWAMSLKI